MQLLFYKSEQAKVQFFVYRKAILSQKYLHFLFFSLLQQYDFVFFVVC